MDEKGRKASEEQLLAVDNLVKSMGQKERIEADNHGQNMADRKQVYELREKYASRLFRLLLVQIIIMDIFMLCVGIGWFHYPSWIFEVFVAGTVVQSFVSIHIIIRNLFPNKSHSTHHNE